MTTDNLCEVIADSVACTLHLMVDPNQDLDGTFEATCLDTGQTLKVNGWLFTLEFV